MDAEEKASKLNMDEFFYNNNNEPRNYITERKRVRKKKGEGDNFLYLCKINMNILL
jgi:predicted secreted protein